MIFNSKHLSGCLKKLILFSTAIIITACSHIKQPQTVSEWQPESTPPHFAAAGKLSVKADKQGFQAAFDWQNNATLKIININTPLGNTVGNLCQDNIGAVARNAKGQVFQAATAGELAHRLTEQDIPLDYLDLWATGRYTTNESHQILPDGNLIQAGWTIQRITHDNGLPYRLILQRPDLKITVLFKEFHPDHSTDQTLCQR